MGNDRHPPGHPWLNYPDLRSKLLRASVKLRADLAVKLAERDARVGAHDEQPVMFVAAIRQLAAFDGPLHRRKIGFYQGNR